MIDAIVHFPEGMLGTPRVNVDCQGAKRDFRIAVATSVAAAIGGTPSDVRVISIAYDPDASSTTAVVMVTVVAHEWGLGTSSLRSALKVIGDGVGRKVPYSWVGTDKVPVAVSFQNRNPSCHVTA
jgi:hypothetical protein